MQDSRPRHSTADDDGTHLHAVVRSLRDELADKLAEWVRVPGVFGVPDHAQDLLRSANWLAAALREAGFPVVEVLPTGDSYAVYAEWCQTSGAPTVLVYSHHDVRVAEPEGWEQTAPFEPVQRDGRLYGRGSSDAKGQVLAHLYGLQAHLGLRRAAGHEDPAVNLKFLVEGEEEGSSPHLAALLNDQAGRFRADLVVFSDTQLWQAGNPALCLSLRGILKAHLEITGAARDVHSGAVSGAVPNPGFELSRVLAALHDGQGRIAIPEFYDEVEPAPEDFRRAVAALPFSEDEWLERAELGGITGEQGYTVPERLWLRPAVEVTGLIAGNPTGVPSGTVPAVASADLVLRTVPGQRVEKVAGQLRQWLQETVGENFGHTLDVDLDTAQEPYRTPDHPAVAVLEAAMANGFSAERVGRMGNAGSGPAELLGRLLQAPVLFFGTGLVEDRWHGSDESANLDVLGNGAVTLACLWDGIAGLEWRRAGHE